MTDTLNVTGSVEKTSEAGGGFKIEIEVADDVDVDTGSKTIVIAPSGTATIDLSDVTPGDGLIIKTPTLVTATATWTGRSPNPVFTDVPVREWLILQTAGLHTLVLTNPDTVSVRLTLNVFRLPT